MVLMALEIRHLSFILKFKKSDAFQIRLGSEPIKGVFDDILQWIHINASQMKSC